MAKRPVYIITEDVHCYQKEMIEFVWVPGQALSRQRQNIRNMQAACAERYPGKKMLEISTKSEDPAGVALSGFELILTEKDGRAVPVEAAFHAGKVFEYGGPFPELKDLPVRKARSDERLTRYGKVIAYEDENGRFPVCSERIYYDWLYVKALHGHPETVRAAVGYEIFTDIAFNPKTMERCQAEAAAIYMSLLRRGQLEEALEDAEHFVAIVNRKENPGIKS